VIRACPGERGIQVLWRPSARKTQAGADRRADGPPRRTHPVIASSDSQGGGTCTRVPPSANHCEQAPCAIQIPLLQHSSRIVCGAQEIASTNVHADCVWIGTQDWLFAGVVGPCESPFVLRASVRRHRSIRGSCLWPTAGWIGSDVAAIFGYERLSPSARRRVPMIRYDETGCRDIEIQLGVA
jgi:hypothetical protein